MRRAASRLSTGRGAAAVVLTVALMLGGPVATAESPGALRFGLTSVFLDDRAAFLERWRAYMSEHLGRPVVFVQRGSYREITALLRQGELDLAWTCGYPYVRNIRAMELVAVPLFRGRPLYQSYLIVPDSDRETQSLADLRDSVFAFSDPDSNSGYLYRRYQLQRRGTDVDAFFQRSFFAQAHRNVVEAVAVGLADAGSVDGYVWETLRRYQPELTGRTRVVSRSPWFGHPPVVARRGLPDPQIEAVRALLTGMPSDAAGRSLLDELNLDGFSVESPALFEDIAAMMRYVDGPD